MSEIQRVSPSDAEELLSQGYAYLDVRTEEEFEQGHVPGALNVPFMLRGIGGMAPNSEFLAVMKASFGPEEKLVVGCRSGGRSLAAVQALRAEGYAELVDLRTGWIGCQDAFGRTEPGWAACKLPTETGRPPGQCYADVKTRSPR